MHTDWSSLSLWFFQLWWFRLTFNKNPPIHYLNKLEYFIRPIKKKNLVNCWPSGKYFHLLYMYSILGRGSFCFNYCLNSAWHGGDQFVALLRWYGSPGFFDSGNFTLDFKQHGFCASPLFLQALGPCFQMKCKIYFHLKRGLWTTELFFSTAQVRRFWRCLWFRSGLVALFLKTSERGDSWCTDSSFSSLLVKLSQVFESALLDCILKLAVIPVACAPFPTQILPSSQHCI